MGRRTRTFLITAVAGAAALIPAASASAGTLDQQQTLNNFPGQNFNAGSSKGQTFTAGLTGQLDQVDLALSGMSLTTPLTVQIQNGSSTGPGGTVLATASVPTSAVTTSETFVPIPFTSPVAVTAGTQYSIVAFNDSVGWVWHAGQASPDSAYVGGKLWSSPDDTGPGSGPWFEGSATADFEFKTYVVPPTTTTPPGGDPPANTKKKCKKKKAKTSPAAAAKKKCKKKRKK